mgnify:CR=1 FL=1
MSETGDRQPLLALVGPTAVGKTALSLEIAERFGCEIISGDSMQVYRGMDIGTAKATPEERARVPHHLIDIRDPWEPFSVSDYRKLAEEAIRGIAARGKLPFIVGGTGLYIQSVCYQYEFPEGGADETYRRELRQFADARGAEALHGLLREVDPETAARLHPNDVRRVIRALELHRLTGVPMSEHLRRQRRSSAYRLIMIGLTMERDMLYRRIEERVDRMIEAGLVEEVAALLEKGCTERMTSMQALGYKEIAEYLRGRVTLAEATENLKRNTRRFAKRQLSWFRGMKDVKWVQLEDADKIYENLATISDIIAGKLALRTEYNGKQC